MQATFKSLNRAEKRGHIKRTIKTSTDGKSKYIEIMRRAPNKKWVLYYPIKIVLTFHIDS